MCSLKLSAFERSLPVVPLVHPATSVVEELFALFALRDPDQQVWVTAKAESSDLCSPPSLNVVIPGCRRLQLVLLAFP